MGLKLAVSEAKLRLGFFGDGSELNEEELLEAIAELSLSLIGNRRFILLN